MLLSVLGRGGSLSKKHRYEMLHVTFFSFLTHSLVKFIFNSSVGVVEWLHRSSARSGNLHTQSCWLSGPLRCRWRSWWLQGGRRLQDAHWHHSHHLRRQKVYGNVTLIHSKFVGLNMQQSPPKKQEKIQSTHLLPPAVIHVFLSIQQTRGSSN